MATREEEGVTILHNGDFISLYAEGMLFCFVCVIPQGSACPALYFRKTSRLAILRFSLKGNRRPTISKAASFRYTTNVIRIDLLVPPSRSHVQVFIASDDAQIGDVIHYGDKIVLLHRASQKFLVKSKIGIGDGFRGSLDSILPMPTYVRSAVTSEDAEESQTSSHNAKYEALVPFAHFQGQHCHELCYFHPDAAVLFQYDRESHPLR